VKDAYDLVEVVRRYADTSPVYHEHHGPCPFCGGSDRFIIFKDRKRCHCRQCEFSGDVIDLVAKLHNVDAKGAAEIITRRQVTISTAPRRIRPTEHWANEDSERTWQSATWQEQARRTVELAKQRMTREDTNDGARYLLGRGILPATIEAFDIGFDPAHFDPATKTKRPAVVIPWCDETGAISAIKYRFCDNIASDDKDRRFSQTSGSKQILFGLQTLARTNAPRALIAVEGEINAMSVWQATRSDGYDVVSVGPENNPACLRALAALLDVSAHADVLLWFDRGDRALAAARALPQVRPALMQSPRDLDANDILTMHGATVLRELVCVRIPTQETKPLNPEMPSHIAAKGVNYWTPSVQNAWAWRDWMQRRLSDPTLPDFETVEECCDYIVNEWRKSSQ
jgi:DNA primase